jgi:hypothetical protein
MKYHNFFQSRMRKRRLLPQFLSIYYRAADEIKVPELAEGAHNFFQSRMRKRRLLPCAGAYNFLLHIFTSLKRKRRFFKCPFTIHLLFLRLRFRLVRQRNTVQNRITIRSSMKKLAPRA